MAVKKNQREAPLQEIKLDPAVEAYMRQGDQAEMYAQIGKEKELTEYQRRKRKKDAARVKATYDLTDWVKSAIEKIADENKTPKGHVANVLLAEALAMYADGQINFAKYKQSSRDPRFEWFLEVDDAPSFSEKQEYFK